MTSNLNYSTSSNPYESKQSLSVIQVLKKSSASTTGSKKKTGRTFKLIETTVVKEEPTQRSSVKTTEFESTQRSSAKATVVDPSKSSKLIKTTEFERSPTQRSSAKTTVVDPSKSSELIEPTELIKSPELSKVPEFIKFSSLRICLASPTRIRQWSERTLPNGEIVGEITNAQTVNYKTLKPEKGGLFCERVFGPVKDFHCSCGKGPTEKNPEVCLTCGVQFLSSQSRRSKMGYIKLFSPVTHVWYLKSSPSVLSSLLELKRTNLEGVTYCSGNFSFNKKSFKTLHFSNLWPLLLTPVEKIAPYQNPGFYKLGPLIDWTLSADKTSPVGRQSWTAEASAGTRTVSGYEVPLPSVKVKTAVGFFLENGLKKKKRVSLTSLVNLELNSWILSPAFKLGWERFILDKFFFLKKRGGVQFKLKDYPLFLIHKNQKLHNKFGGVSPNLDFMEVICPSTILKPRKQSYDLVSRCQPLFNFYTDYGQLLTKPYLDPFGLKSFVKKALISQNSINPTEFHLAFWTVSKVDSRHSSPYEVPFTEGKSNPQTFTEGKSNPQTFIEDKSNPPGTILSGTILSVGTTPGYTASFLPFDFSPKGKNSEKRRLWLAENSKLPKVVSSLPPEDSLAPRIFVENCKEFFSLLNYQILFKVIKTESFLKRSNYFFHTFKSEGRPFPRQGFDQLGNSLRLFQPEGNSLKGLEGRTPFASLQSKPIKFALQTDKVAEKMREGSLLGLGKNSEKRRLWLAKNSLRNSLDLVNLGVPNNLLETVVGLAGQFPKITEIEWLSVAEAFSAADSQWFEYLKVLIPEEDPLESMLNFNVDHLNLPYLPMVDEWFVYSMDLGIVPNHLKSFELVEMNWPSGQFKDWNFDNPFKDWNYDKWSGVYPWVDHDDVIEEGFEERLASGQNFWSLAVKSNQLGNSDFRTYLLDLGIVLLDSGSVLNQDFELVKINWPDGHFEDWHYDKWSSVYPRIDHDDLIEEGFEKRVVSDLFSEFFPSQKRLLFPEFFPLGENSSILDVKPNPLGNSKFRTYFLIKMALTAKITQFRIELVELWIEWLDEFRVKRGKGQKKKLFIRELKAFKKCLKKFKKQFKNKELKDFLPITYFELVKRIWPYGQQFKGWNYDKSDYDVSPWFIDDNLIEEGFEKRVVSDFFPRSIPSSILDVKPNPLGNSKFRTYFSRKLALSVKRAELICQLKKFKKDLRIAYQAKKSPPALEKAYSLNSYLSFDNFFQLIFLIFEVPKFNSHEFNFALSTDKVFLGQKTIPFKTRFHLYQFLNSKTFFSKTKLLPSVKGTSYVSNPIYLNVLQSELFLDSFFVCLRSGRLEIDGLQALGGYQSLCCNHSLQPKRSFREVEEDASFGTPESIKKSKGRWGAWGSSFVDSEKSLHWKERGFEEFSHEFPHPATVVDHLKLFPGKSFQPSSLVPNREPTGLQLTPPGFLNWDSKKEFFFTKKLRLSLFLKKPRLLNNYYTISQSARWSGHPTEWQGFKEYMTVVADAKDSLIPSYVERGISFQLVERGGASVKLFLDLFQSLPYVERDLSQPLQLLKTHLLKRIDRETKRSKQFETYLDVKDLVKIPHSLVKELYKKLAISKSIRDKALRRLKALLPFEPSPNKTTVLPNWMVLSILPVLPPALRPIIPLDSQQIAVSDLTKLYQTVLFRNKRVKRFYKEHPSLNRSESVQYAQRLLQEAVDALIENGKGNSPVITASNNRPLKSLSDMLKGKKGRFRQNLLGKRVDYSGRSVIVVGPQLKLHECGLPKEMAIELFQPFLIRQFILNGAARNFITAKRQIKMSSETSGFLNILRDVMENRPVLLNRAPTLHRLGIQAFQPKLVSGRAILLHPLVCTAFNADFDGDQMAVHIPLSYKACSEAWKLMGSRNNILSPATGEPILVPSQDMVLGCYYLTTVDRVQTRKKLQHSSFFYPSAPLVEPPGFVDKRGRFGLPLGLRTNLSDLPFGDKVEDPDVQKVNLNREFQGSDQSVEPTIPESWFAQQEISTKFKSCLSFAYRQNKFSEFFEEKESKLAQGSVFLKRFESTKRISLKREKALPYYSNWDQVFQALNQQSIHFHSSVWLRWNSYFEFALKRESCLEIRLDKFGNSVCLKQSYQSYGRGLAKQPVTQTGFYIRTTPGRILMNQLIFESLSPPRLKKIRRRS